MTHTEQYYRSIEDTFAECLLTMKAKSDDYAEDSDRFSNFRFAAEAAGVTVEQVFLVLYGIKLARLKNLLLSGAEPNNESIEDTLSDAINYKAILRAYRQLKNSKSPEYAYADSTDLLSDEEPLQDDAAQVEGPTGEGPTPPEQSFDNLREMTPVDRFKALFGRLQ